MESGDDVLRKFWEVEESPKSSVLKKNTVVQHFELTHSRNNSGRFVIPLPKDPHAKPKGESRSQAVRRFFSMEHILRSKNQFEEFSIVMQEYIGMKHAEAVPVVDSETKRQYFLPANAHCKKGTEHNHQDKSSV